MKKNTVSSAVRSDADTMPRVLVAHTGTIHYYMDEDYKFPPNILGYTTYQDYSYQEIIASQKYYESKNEKVIISIGELYYETP